MSRNIIQLFFDGLPFIVLLLIRSAAASRLSELETSESRIIDRREFSNRTLFCLSLDESIP